jgi:hypothetical protein
MFEKVPSVVVLQKSVEAVNVVVLVVLSCG